MCFDLFHAGFLLFHAGFLLFHTFPNTFTQFFRNRIQLFLLLFLELHRIHHIFVDILSHLVG